MSITIDLAPETERKLAERATANGKDLAGYVNWLIEKDLSQPVSLTEILAPFRREVAASGMTDDELEQLFRDARQEVRQEKQRAKQ